MNELKFACGTPTEDIFTNNDFLLEYDWEWNMKGSFAWFRVIALPSITGWKHCAPNLGHIWISDRKLNPFFIHRSSPPMLVADEDVLTKTMGFNTSFCTIPPSFHSLLLPEVAKHLFILLSPCQRQNFIEALNVITDEQSYNKCFSEQILPPYIMRDYDNWDKWENPSPIKKYLFSDIDFKALPINNYYNKNN